MNGLGIWTESIRTLMSPPMIDEETAKEMMDANDNGRLNEYINNLEDGVWRNPNIVDATLSFFAHFNRDSYLYEMSGK